MCKVFHLLKILHLLKIFHLLKPKAYVPILCSMLDVRIVFSGLGICYCVHLPGGGIVSLTNSSEGGEQEAKLLKCFVLFH